MSTIDPSIPLQVRPMQVDILQAMHQAQSLRDLAQQRQMRSLQMQNEQQIIQENQRKVQESQRIDADRQKVPEIIKRHQTIDEAEDPGNQLNYDLNGIAADPDFAQLHPAVRKEILDNAKEWVTASNAQHAETVKRHKETLEKLKTEGEDIADTGDQQQYAKYKAKIYNAGLAPVGSLPVMLKAGGKEALGKITDNIDRHLTVTQEDRDKAKKAALETKKAQLELDKTTEETADAKLSDDDWMKKHFPDDFTKYGSFEKSPSFLKTAIRKKRTGVDATPLKVEKWEADDAVIYQAWADKLKKPVEQLSAQDKLNAKKAAEGGTAFEKEVVIKTKMRQNDPELFHDLFGRGSKPLSQAQVLNRIITQVERANTTDDEKKEIYERWRQLYSESEEDPIDLPPWKDAKKPPTPLPTKEATFIERIVGPATPGAALAVAKAKQEAVPAMIESGKIATRAQVEAAARKNGITFEEAKRRVEATGGTVQ